MKKNHILLWNLCEIPQEIKKKRRRRKKYFVPSLEACVIWDQNSHQPSAISHSNLQTIHPELTKTTKDGQTGRNERKKKVNLHIVVNNIMMLLLLFLSFF